MSACISSITAVLCIACVTAAAYEPHKDNMEAIEIPHSAESARTRISKSDPYVRRAGEAEFRPS